MQKYYNAITRFLIRCPEKKNHTQENLLTKVALFLFGNGILRFRMWCY